MLVKVLILVLQGMGDGDWAMSRRTRYALWGLGVGQDEQQMTNPVVMELLHVL